MNENNLLSDGLFIDDTNKIRIIDPQLSHKTNQLREECNEFNEKTQHFQKIVENFVSIIEKLVTCVEREKIKAVGSRNLLKSVEKRQNSDKQQLQTLIKEKKQHLERLRVQLDSLKREEAQQMDLIEQIIVQKSDFSQQIFANELIVSKILSSLTSKQLMNSCISVNQLWYSLTRKLIQNRNKVEHYFELYRIGRHNTVNNTIRETHLSDNKELSFVSECFEQIETKISDKLRNELNIRPEVVITFFGNFCPHSKRPERLMQYNSFRHYFMAETQLLNVISSAGLIGSVIRAANERINPMPVPTESSSKANGTHSRHTSTPSKEPLIEPIETQAQVGNCAGISIIIFTKYPNVEIDIIEDRNLIVLEKLKSRNDLKCLVVFATTCGGKTGSFKELQTINQLKDKYNNKIAIGGIIIDEINYFSTNLSSSRKKSRDFYGIAFSGSNVRACSLLFNTKTPDDTERKFRQFRQNLDFDPYLKNCETIAFMFICTGRGVHTDDYPASNIESTLFRKVFPNILVVGVFGQGEFGHNYWPSITRQKQLQLSDELQEDKSNGHELWHFYTSVLVLINLPKK